VNSSLLLYLHRGSQLLDGLGSEDVENEFATPSAPLGGPLSPAVQAYGRA